MNCGEIHTIKVKKETILRLVQYEDQISPIVPSLTFTKSVAMPSIEGAYQKFTQQELLSRLRQIISFGLDFNSDWLVWK